MDNDGYPRTSHLPPFRSYDPLPISTEPLIRGRKPNGSRWILDMGSYIRRREYYDRSLTEEDLKRLVSQRKGNDERTE